MLPSTSHNSTALTDNTSPVYIGRLQTSPIGPLWVAITELGLGAVEWNMSPLEFSKRVERYFHTEAVYAESRTLNALSQLSEYLVGKRRDFDLLLDLSRLTAFQLQVLQLTYHIPYGQTSTYKDIAVQTGNPRAARAVGRAEATNPIPLVIPCHRVLGSDGSLHGYGGPGGIKMKSWLLELEASVVK